jgi:hypothetical protein
MLRVAVLSACVAASLSKPTQRRNEAGTWNYDRCDVREMLTPAVHAASRVLLVPQYWRRRCLRVWRLSLPAGAT